jgi:hypothetical protein
VSSYTRREIVHTLFALSVTVVVAVCAELMDIASFREVSAAGLAVTAVRSLATAVFVLGSPYAVRRE